MTMSRQVADWSAAADDAYSFLNERKRTFAKPKMWKLIDDLAVKQSVTQEQLLTTHGDVDFIATTIGLVTTAIHGPGTVPKEGGWYRVTLTPHTYHVNDAFAHAWKKKRRLL
jgi:hypothetical protein